MFISDSSRSVAAAHHCFDQQLFRYRHFLPDCTQNETAHRNVWRFNRLRKCRSHSPSRLRHWKADFGDFLSSLVFSVWLLCHFFFICQEAKTGTLKILGDQVRQYPERLFTDQSKINVRLLTGRFAYPHVYIQITKRTNNLIGLFANELDPFFFFFLFLLRSYKHSANSSLWINSKRMAPVVFTSPILCRSRTDSGQLLCRKTASSHRLLTTRRLCFFFFSSSADFFWLYIDCCTTCSMMTLWESGLPKFWMNVVIPRNECSAKIKPRRQNQATRRLVGPIKLNDLNGVFLILGIGAGLATFVFLIEKIIHFRRQFT